MQLPDLHELKLVCLGYDKRYTAATVCTYDGFCELTDALGYVGQFKSMTAAAAEYILCQLVAYAPALYLWEIICLWDGVRMFAPD